VRVLPLRKYEPPSTTSSRRLRSIRALQVSGDELSLTWGDQIEFGDEIKSGIQVGISRIISRIYFTGNPRLQTKYSKKSQNASRPLEPRYKYCRTKSKSYLHEFDPKTRPIGWITCKVHQSVASDVSGDLLQFEAQVMYRITLLLRGYGVWYLVGRSVTTRDRGVRRV